MSKIDLLSCLETQEQKENKKIFKTKEDLVIFEIKNNINPRIIKRKLEELKQLEKDLLEIKQQEEELGMCLEEDGEIQAKIKKLKHWLEENTIKHIVKKMRYSLEYL